jgi:hypothetical protein
MMRRMGRSPLSVGAGIWANGQPPAASGCFIATGLRHRRCSGSAFAVVLLTAAAVNARSLRALMAVDLGFDADGLAPAQLALPAARHPEPGGRPRPSRRCPPSRSSPARCPRAGSCASIHSGC